MRIDLSLGLGSVAMRRRGGSAGPTLGPYLPVLASAALAVWGARRMVGGYAGNLYTLRKASGGTLDVSAATGSELPDYAAIASWAGGDDLFVTAVYDQAGGGKQLSQATTANQPEFDLGKALAGCVPFAIAGLDNLSREWLVTDTSLSFDRTSLSVWMVFAPQAAVNTMVFWEAGGTFASCFLSAAQAGVQYYTTASTFTGSGGIPRAQAAVFGANLGATEIVTTLREQVMTGANGAAGAGNQFVLGENATFGGDYAAAYHCWAVTLYPSLSPADQSTLRQSLAAIYSVSTAFTARVVFIGDSITEGWHVDKLRTVTSQLDGMLPGTPEIFNLGVSGITMATQASTTYPAYAEPLFTDDYGAGRCMLVIASGINDIAIGGADAAALQTTASAFVAAAQADGFTVGLATLLPYSTWAALDPIKEGYRIAYNAWVLAGSSGADFVIDAGSASGVTTIDGVHPDGDGYAALAATRYGPALTAALS